MGTIADGRLALIAGSGLNASYIPPLCYSVGLHPQALPRCLNFFPHPEPMPGAGAFALSMIVD